VESTSRRRRHQQTAASSSHTPAGAALFAGAGTLTPAGTAQAGTTLGNAYVFRPAKTKGRAQYGHRRSVCLQEWAQHAIIAMYPNAPPKISRAHRRSRMAPINQAHLSERVPINQSHLCERVNEYLKELAKQNHADAKKYRDSGYAGERISRKTVVRALKALQEANH
jgi:hypothetical protein